MWIPRAVIQLELTEPFPELSRFPGRCELQALLTWHGVPCAWQAVELEGDRPICTGLAAAIVDKHFDSICGRVTREHLLAGHALALDTLFELDSASAVRASSPSAPTVSIALCTRNRPDDLRSCLQALRDMQPAPFEILVVDNAPSDETSLAVVAAMPGVRYVREPRAGLSWARNRAIVESRGDVIAFVDDDVIVDRRWAGALGQAFAENPAAGLVTGLILPRELETEAQLLFEIHGGFGRGYEPRWYHHSASDGRLSWRSAATGKLGSGANMAFRRSVFERVGLFATELGAGTRTLGGEDLEMLYRVVKRGIAILYEPRAFVWHRHRREAAELFAQIHGWGTGNVGFIQHAKRLFSDERWSLRLFEQASIASLVKRTVSQRLLHRAMPPELPVKQLLGTLGGRARYRAARRIAREIEERFGPMNVGGYPEAPGLPPAGNSERRRDATHREVDLGHDIAALEQVAEYDRVLISVVRGRRPLAGLEIETRGFETSRDRLINLLLESRSAVEWLALLEDLPAARVEAELRARLISSIFPRPHGARNASSEAARHEFQPLAFDHESHRTAAQRSGD